MIAGDKLHVAMGELTHFSRQQSFKGAATFALVLLFS
jgi:hypothetical protein